jgi:peptidoglycan/LPS O-acetylase OafA/YrhL
VDEQKKFPRIPELDGLRGFAALAVFASHFVQVQPIDRESSAVLRIFARLAEFGPLGVDVFFCLSGFLITSLLLVDREKSSYFYNFYWKRALRILPVYVVHLLAAAFLLPNSAGYILLSILFIVNFAGPLHVTVVGPAWTLSIEEQFYLIWPQIVRRMRLGGIYYIAFGLIVSSTLLRLVVPLWHGGIDLNFTFYRCDGLALGAILGCQWFSKQGRDRLINAVLAVLNSNVTLVVLVVGELFLLLRFGHYKLLPQMNITTTNYLIYRLMRFILANRGQGGKRFSWLGSPIPVYLGSISYALYLYQSFVMLKVSLYLGNAPAAEVRPIMIRLALDFVITVFICTISRYAMELPVQRLRRFVLRPSRAAA